MCAVSARELRRGPRFADLRPVRAEAKTQPTVGSLQVWGSYVTERAEWDADATPWARRQGTGQTLPCYFCGEKTAILAFGDLPDDPGRLELYCDSPMCDAREVVVLVLRDGASADERADVRALEEVDRPNKTPQKGDVMGRYNDNKNLTRRRQNPRSLVVTAESEEEN
nr:hypothetical protein [Streptomyces sp. SID5466]